MTREQKIARARELRERGRPLREITAELGVPKSTASQWLSDPDGTKARARKKRYHGTCIDCGGETDGTASGRAQEVKRCAPCAWAYQHAARYWTGERICEALRRYERETGRRPTGRDVLGRDADYLPWWEVIRREFGTFNAAMVAAGFTPRGSGKRGPDRKPRKRRQVAA